MQTCLSPTPLLFLSALAFILIYSVSISYSTSSIPILSLPLPTHFVFPTFYSANDPLFHSLLLLLCHVNLNYCCLGPIVLLDLSLLFIYVRFVNWFLTLGSHWSSMEQIGIYFSIFSIFLILIFYSIYF